MSFEAKMVIWPVFLLSLYWFSQDSVEAKLLPKEHMKEATECLREYVKEDFVHKSFQNTLSYGEYLGDLCRDVDIEKIEEKVLKDKEGHGLEVQQCLDKKELPQVYTKIRNFGVDQLTKLEEQRKAKLQEMRTDASIRTTSASPYTERKSTLDEDVSDEEADELPSVPTKPPVKDGKVAGASRLDEKPSTSPADISEQKLPIPPADMSDEDESQKLPGNDPDEIDPENFSDLGKYVVGMCLKDDTLDFKELEKEEEKTITFECLQDCTTRFFGRIKKILSEGRTQIVKIMEEKEKELRENKKGSEVVDAAKDAKITPELYQKKIENFKQKTEINEKEDAFAEAIRKFGLEKATSEKGVETITTPGQEFLIRYSKVYKYIDAYLGESDVAPDEDLDAEIIQKMQKIPSNVDTEESHNNKLRTSFILFKSCSKVQCSMKIPKSVPLYSFIHDQANEPETEMKSPLIPQQEIEPTSEQKFFVALTHNLDADDDDDDDSSGGEQDTV